MKKKTYLFATLLTTFLLLSCSEAHGETAQKETTDSEKSAEDVPPMVIKKFEQPFSPVMENFHMKILRLSSTEFIKEYNAMTPEQRAEFAAEFLKEESIALLKEQGEKPDEQANPQELAKAALVHYSTFINQNQ